jgi:hypothetical protein
MIKLRRTIRRLLDNGIVVEIGPHGIDMRRPYAKKRLSVSWDQIASLSGTKPEEKLIRFAEQEAGKEMIERMKNKGKRCGALA